MNFQRKFHRMFFQLFNSKTLSINCTGTTFLFCLLFDQNFNWSFEQASLGIADIIYTTFSMVCTNHDLQSTQNKSTWHETQPIISSIFFFIWISSTNLCTQEHLGQKLATDWRKFVLAIQRFTWETFFLYIFKRLTVDIRSSGTVWKSFWVFSFTGIRHAHQKQGSKRILYYM